MATPDEKRIIRSHTRWLKRLRRDFFDDESGYWFAPDGVLLDLPELRQRQKVTKNA